MRRCSFAISTVAIAMILVAPMTAQSRPVLPPVKPILSPPLPTARPKAAPQASKHAARTVSISARPHRQPVYSALTLRDEDSGALPTLPAPVTLRPMLGWPSLVAEARKYMGTNPTSRKRLWCATFMNFILAKAGYAGTGSDAARSFVSYGRRIREPRIGAIAVLTRGKNGGHVGIVTGIDQTGNPIILSGNHGRKVGEGVYSRSRVIAYVMPTDRQHVAVASARPSVAAGRASDAPTEEGIASPITELLAAINEETPQASEHTGPDARQARRMPPPAARRAFAQEFREQELREQELRGQQTRGQETRRREARAVRAPQRTAARTSARPSLQAYRVVEQAPGTPQRRGVSPESELARFFGGR
jgi:uncharacterized protein (TIGR02594 family)